MCFQEESRFKVCGDWSVHIIYYIDNLPVKIIILKARHCSWGRRLYSNITRIRVFKIGYLQFFLYSFLDSRILQHISFQTAWTTALTFSRKPHRFENNFLIENSERRSSFWFLHRNPTEIPNYVNHCFSRLSSILWKKMWTVRYFLC